jgi:hypothetical protein
MSGALGNRCRRACVLALVLLALSGCGYGSKVQHGNIEVYYTDGVTQAEADRLGAYLAKTWGAAGGRRSVQIKKTDDGYQFRMVVRKEFQKNENMLKRLQFDAARVSRDVFDGAAVELHACDEHLRTLQAFPPRPDVRYGFVEGKAEVFFASDVPKADAERLAKYLAGLIKTAPAPISFKLARRGKAVEVHMVVQAHLLNDANLLAALRRDRGAIAANVFPGATVELHLCDDAFNVLQVLKE